MKISIYFLSILPLTSCQQSLIPTYFNSDDEYYRSIINEKNGIIVILENLEARDDLLVFDVEVRNNTTTDILVDPLEFYYQSYYDLPAMPQESTSVKYVNFKKEFSMDQWDVSRHYQNKIKERKAGNTVLAILAVGLVITDAYLDAKSDSKPITSENEYKKAVNNAALRDAGTVAGLLAIDAAVATNDMKSMKNDEDLYYLPDEYLNQSVLRPNEKCRGKVFFKKGEALTPFYQVFIPIEHEFEDEMFILDFKKERNRDRKRINNNFPE